MIRFINIFIYIVNAVVVVFFFVAFLLEADSCGFCFFLRFSIFLAVRTTDITPPHPKHKSPTQSDDAHTRLLAT